MEHNTLGGILEHLTNRLNGKFDQQEMQSIKKNISEAVLNIPYHQVFLNPRISIESSKVLEVERVISELLMGKPLQYAIGFAFFSGLTLKVNPSVLIPRPETEELVSLIVRENDALNPKILDVGTGSGCIALALAKQITGAQVTGIDISADALAVAKENAKYNDIYANFIQVDIFQPTNLKGSTFDIVVSNPPYVRDSEKKLMHGNVLNFEPHIALFVPDSDPLVYYRAIALFAAESLSQSGWLWLEINEALGDETAALLSSYGFNVEVRSDFRDKPRFVKAQKASNG